MDELYLMKINVKISKFVGVMYTAKLVKTILINSTSKLAELFKPVQGSAPKLIHVSPLFTTAGGGKTKCVYSDVICGSKGYLVKCNGPPRPIVLDGSFYFYLGFSTKAISISEVFSGLLNNSSKCFNFASQNICIELESIEALNAQSKGLEIARKTLESGGLKIVFTSPATLRDPLRIAGKYKSYTPLPFIVFATPIYTLLQNKGLYTVRRMRTELLMLHRLFNETYSLMGGIRIKWIHYGKKPEPTLVGYVNYRLNNEYIEHLKTRLDVEKWLSEIFAYTLALGVGAGRATGFGHVDLKPIKTEAKENET